MSWLRPLNRFPLTKDMRRQPRTRDCKLFAGMAQETILSSRLIVGVAWFNRLMSSSSSSLGVRERAAFLTD